jgi:hypothetical protein
LSQKSGLKQNLLIATLLLGISISAWSKWIEKTYGYDCGLFSVTTGPAAIVGWYLGILVSIIAICMLLFFYLIKKTN